MTREVEYKRVAAQNVATYNVSFAAVDTEYSQLLPDGTKTIELKSRDGAEIRWAWETGKVATPTAPYHTLLANTVKKVDNLFLVNKTIYLAADVSNNVAEIELFY